MNVGMLEETMHEALGCYDAAVAEWEEAPRRNETDVFTERVLDEEGSTITRRYGKVMAPGMFREERLAAQRREIVSLREAYATREWWERFQPRRWLHAKDDYDKGRWHAAPLTEKAWVEHVRKKMRPEDTQQRLSRLFVTVTPVVALLQQVSDNVNDVAGEIMASFPPRRKSKSHHLLSWWRNSDPMDSRSHREIVVEYLIGFGKDKKRKPEDPLPHFGSDPIYDFLMRYCKKLGRATGRSNWVLRQAAREVVIP